MNIALIIARLGSKRIKNKNIKNFFGKPVIYYPITACQKSNIFDKIFVSTESKKIRLIAKRYNVSVPFLRPKKLSSDKASTIDVIKNFIKKMKISKDNNICCVYPVTPLLKATMLKKFFYIFSKSRKNFLVPIQRTKNLKENYFKINKKGKICKKGKSKTFFKDSGQFYFGTAEMFNNKKSILFGGNCKTIEIPKEAAVDVNTLKDWELVKKIYKKKINE